MLAQAFLAKMKLKRLMPETEVARLVPAVAFLREVEALIWAVFWEYWVVLRVEVEGTETYSRMSASDMLVWVDGGGSWFDLFLLIVY